MKKLLLILSLLGIYSVNCNPDKTALYSDALRGAGAAAVLYGSIFVGVGTMSARNYIKIKDQSLAVKISTPKDLVSINTNEPKNLASVTSGIDSCQEIQTQQAKKRAKTELAIGYTSLFLGGSAIMLSSKMVQK
ncbi:hypothetical protein M1446_00310 [Candidatus Dependentiae bacterium]|nr:hypothetical protein [Candidatus Dependentiae bacterium]